MIEMKVGLPYIVTKASDDGTFEVGDNVAICSDGALMCRQAQGWIEKEDLPFATKGMEIELDNESIEKRRQKLLADLANLGG